MSQDHLSKKSAVYLLEWQNFIKHWGGLSCGDNAPFLCKQTFFEYILKDNIKDYISILKIPTSILKLNELYVRSQDLLFRICENYPIEFQLRKSVLKDKFPHLFNFDIAQNAKKYKAKKQSIEYIYTDVIPVNKVKEIGVNEFDMSTNCNRQKILDFFKQILSNNNEKNTLKIYE